MTDLFAGEAPNSRPPSAWRIESRIGARQIAVVLLVFLALFVTGQRVEIGRMVSLTSEGLLATLGWREHSQVSAGLASLGRQLFPVQLSEHTEVSRIENFDRDHLPWLSRLEVDTVHEQRLNPRTLQMEDHVAQREVLIEPLGYLWHVAAKMVETIEIAVWATLLGMLLSFPLAWLSARNYSPNRACYALARALVSLLRAVPELVSALFLVLAYGFGPIAGVLALALHGAGFLGKFYAEDIETADARPQEALRAIGASQLLVMRYAVLPQVMPQFIGYTLYVLDRNVRMATVVGLVGAGGIGQELKGRYDMYNYAHVGTILIAIFLTVFVLDQLSARWRRRHA
ncbi:phosphonate ABC transporter, permease protein PhnE [Variovorax saccharolyticus]|uniref:phosphonate ABC transporter, permease protein PhnE n=1 Tax=Variovorax saccharolyticus TaxID=3053516 RepID=UPI0025772E5D|nr:phosphonate ABC transporter, permease protein PhnE [Variovorax sp. J22R187]MDM0020826.1 phosphonate ABC transporter, permease protein PhnE [Variovorax sp. J22R187]